MAATDKRRAVLDEIIAFNHDRKPKRVRLKLQRMDESPFSFFRGTDHLFARAWSELRPPDVGPTALLCGDLHLENFGAYRSDNNTYLFDINDFDEALVGPVSLDLVRCAASILLAAEQWRLSPLQASGMALAYLEKYKQALTTKPQAHPVDFSAPREERGAVWELLGATVVGSQLSLLKEVTELSKGGTRRIVRNKVKRPSIRGSRTKEIEQAVKHYAKDKPDPGVYKVHDVSGRNIGLGSLGLRRYLVLIEGEGSPDGNRLLDIKDVRPSSLLACCPEIQQPDFGGNEALRVVEAQRTLQAEPTAGLDVIVIAGESFRMREMIPDDNRSSLDRLQKKPEKLREAVEVAGRLTGWSHLRGCRGDTAASLREWAGGPALDAMLAAAARCAERTRIEYDRFHLALTLPGALPKALRPQPKAHRAH
jgi:uncharacterized protein (DUF2252 family)